jgi:protein-S-isoprenylcysteine O-methyltransferase Ste14
MRTTDASRLMAGPSWLAVAFAWIGGGLFVISLSYFLFSYAITFSETSSEETAARALLVDVTLFTAFALHHSIFARARVRRWVERRAPPMLERSMYVWISSVLFIVVCALWRPLPGVAWHITGAPALALHAAQLAGAWLAVRSAAIIDVWELAGIRQLQPGTGRPPVPEFKVTGPYGWVRHPIYTGWLLMVFCAPRMTMTRFVFAVVSSAYLLIAIPFEERSLARLSAGGYEVYMRRVRWKLIPGIY